MTTKYTRCPHCRTVFRLHLEELPAAGAMRCGNCLKPFAVDHHLMDELPAPAPVDTAAVDGDAEGAVSVVEEAPAPSEPAEAPPDPEALPPGLVADMAAHEGAGSGGRRVLGVVLAGLLLGLLAVQVALFQPAAVAEVMPRLVPLVEGLMPLRHEILALAGEEDAPPYRDPSRIELLSRDVRSHPTIADALLARAVMANTAPLSQPFPAIGFTLFDVNGATLASREFRPEEYLGRPPPPAMRPHQPYQFTLSLLAPKLDAVSFEFTFH